MHIATHINKISFNDWWRGICFSGVTWLYHNERCKVRIGMSSKSYCSLRLCCIFFVHPPKQKLIRVIAVTGFKEGILMGKRYLYFFTKKKSGFWSPLRITTSNLLSTCDKPTRNRQARITTICKFISVTIVFSTETDR